MRFARPSRRSAPREAVVPMINVVFLLLIFFLISSSLAPAPPFDVAPPATTADGPAGDPTPIFIDASGRLAYGVARGEAVWAALETHGAVPLDIRADRDLEATELARVLRRVAEAGVTSTRLVTVAP